jgi:Animal haem peroxidase
MARSTGSTRRLGIALLVAAAAVAVIRRANRTQGYRQSLPWRLFDDAAQTLDQTYGWHRLPLLVSLAALIGLRNILRQRNLYDTTQEPVIELPPLDPPDARYLTARSPDGAYNDLQNPRMGMAGSRFGRNVPIEHTYPEAEAGILSPSPRSVSLELMTRTTFQPATTLNALAAAWLQFMIRDWFSHGRSEKQNPWTIRLADDDPWPQHPMQIMRTRHDPTRPPDSTRTPPTYVNTETHWWDASQLYGSSREVRKMVRSGQQGKLRIREDGVLALPDDPKHDPRIVPGWWLGLEMMQTVFVLEHNAICDRLRAEYPSWSDDDLFEHARLVCAALIAKIHTVEWTPALLGHPALQIGMRANWWGLAMERVTKLWGRLSDSEIVSGIPGSPTNHYDVPYALTEEFVAVYRMHPLIPDDYSFRSAADDTAIEDRTFNKITGAQAHELMEHIPATDLFYTFGTMHPGAIVLHNYPRFLQYFERPDGLMLDLAAVDILRSRELGVPRYNDFRRLLHMKPAGSFEELTDTPEWREQIRRVYDNDIERVDLTVGMFAEPLPAGFAFSDTAFRIFILMASRRLNSDRFFTTDYTAQVYTQAGLDWINDNDMSSVLLRHYPHLRPALRAVKNAFAPWGKASL